MPPDTLPRSDAERLAGSVGACWTYADLAGFLRISTRSAKRMVASGRLPQPDVRLGAQVVRWSPRTVEKFLRQTAAEPGAS
jgi:predicted DNA-binding transcriptional regulator AlpA